MASSTCKMLEQSIIENGGLNLSLSRFTRRCTDPLLYLKHSDSTSKEIVSLTKDLFDFASQDENKVLKTKCPLEELLVDGFNDEQIWQEIQLKNKLLLDVVGKEITHLMADGLSVNLNESILETTELSEEDDTMEELNQTNSSDEEELSENEGDEDETELKGDKVAHAKRSVVDDKFFSLAQMEEFLNFEDRREEKRRDGEEDDDENSDSDEESVDLFNNMNDDDAEEEDDDDWDAALMETNKLVGREIKSDSKEKKGSTKMMYEDFFDPPTIEKALKKSEKQNGIEEEGFDEDGNPEENKSDEEELEDGEEKQDEEMEKMDDGSDAESDSEAGKKTSEEKENLSAFEKKEMKMKRKIEELEEVNLEKKSWQLSGESSSGHRPVNSILEEHLVFDHTSAPAPVITEETTKSLEDIIIQRIKDQAWDDVERKQKPTKEPFEYKKQQPLDQEKSKISLGEVYEQEYLKQTQKEDVDKEKEEHTEIKDLMSKLFTKLDALSNFHFTPKPPKLDVDIITNVASITMEEVQPIGVSDSTLLAPHEVHANKNAEGKGDTEKDKTDKLRERRKKKTQQRWSHRERERCKQLVDMMQPGLGNKYSKQNAMKKLENDSKTSKNTTVLSEKDNNNSGKMTSSSAFFTKLQEKVTETVKSKKDSVDKKKTKSITAAQLKL